MLLETNNLTNDIYDRSFYSTYRRYINQLTLKMTSVNVISNSPSQDYTHPDDGTLLNYDTTPGFKPFTILKIPPSVPEKSLPSRNQVKHMSAKRLEKR